MQNTMNNTDCPNCGAAIGECSGYCNALPNELDDASDNKQPTMFDGFWDMHAERVKSVDYGDLYGELMTWYKELHKENGILAAVMTSIIKQEIARRKAAL